MKFVRLVSTAFLPSLLFTSVLAQANGGSSTTPSQQQPLPPGRVTSQQERQMSLPADHGSPRSVEEQGRMRDPRYNREMERAKPALKWKEAQLTKKEKAKLVANEADLKLHAQFLSLPDTGLCKLVAANDRTRDARTEKMEIPISGGGAFYSFTKRRHDADEWAQVNLQDGAFRAAFYRERMIDYIESNRGGYQEQSIYQVNFASGERLAMFTELGDVALDKVSADTPGVELLRTFPPPTTYAHYLAQAKQMQEGIKANGFEYKSSVPAKLFTTYALRAVNYGKADSLLVFRVIRVEADGSTHLLWKQLAAYPLPKLEGKQK